MKLVEKVKMDLTVKSKEDYKKVVLSMLERDERAAILDLGCGDSRRLSNKIMERVGSGELHGVDIKWEGPMRNLRIYQADLNGPLPTASGYFDVVVASQIIEHLWNTDGFLKEVYRCLKPTGYAIISTPNLASWHNRLYLLLGRQPEPCKVSEEMYPGYETPGHLRVFVAGELMKLLRFHGFKIEGKKRTFGTITVRMGK